MPRWCRVAATPNLPSCRPASPCACRLAWVLSRLPACPKREFGAQLLLPRQVEKLKKQVAELQARIDALKP